MTSERVAMAPPSPVPHYRRIDVIGGATIIFIAGLIWYGAIELTVGQIANFASGALPKAISIILFAAGGWVFLHGLMQRGEEAERFEFAFRPTAIVVLAIVLFGLFIRGGDFGLISTPQLGLMVVGPLTVFIAGSATPQMQVRQLLILSFGLTAGMLLLFPDLLRAPIPVFPKFLQGAIPPSFGIGAAVRVLYAAYAALAAALYVVFYRMAETQRD
ncbi:tripartite tricarboxylate transporter TctB family protein [Devosia ginsengisoli]|uniref:tripartite tricarboxylate transporter TctB family protein n=1 Tax=Devosia ginsengisoli TaxID=400770 RepID=UPI0026EE46E4|nr:tripartite tricarboxylate transporter TctB family protein [Devosia ginsengisoli]MCR6673446.1 tripartite tricarboxylate transporter TctB family protein [Devosia ginsengisoli]